MALPSLAAARVFPQRRASFSPPWCFSLVFSGPLFLYFLSFVLISLSLSWILAQSRDRVAGSEGTWYRVRLVQGVRAGRECGRGRGRGRGLGARAWGVARCRGVVLREVRGPGAEQGWCRAWARGASVGVGEGEGAGLGRGKGRGVVQQETSLGAAGGLFGWILCFPDLEAFVFLHMLSVVFLSETLRSNIAMPLFCLDLGYQSGNHWRLIGFFGSKPKEKDEVGEVVTGETAFSVLKGALVPLLKFGNKGLQRIAIVRAWLGAHGDKGGAWVCMEVHGPPID